MKPSHVNNYYKKRKDKKLLSINWHTKPEILQIDKINIEK